MPIPTIIALKYTGAIAQSWLLIGGTSPVQDGNNFSITNTDTGITGVTTRRTINRIVEFLGKRFAFIAEDILERDTGGAGNWGRPAGANVIQLRQGRNLSGVHLLHSQGQPQLIVAYIDTAYNFRVYRSFNGTTFSLIHLGAPNLTSGLSKWGPSIIFRDTLYYHIQTSGNAGVDILTYNFATATAAGLSALQDNGRLLQTCLDFAVHKNNLFFVAVPESNLGAADPYRVKRFNGNSFDTAYTLTGTGINFGRASAHNGGGPILFTDPASGNLIAICPGVDNGGTNEGFQAVSITDADTALNKSIDDAEATDITATVIPASLQPGGGSATSQSQLQVIIDNDTDPTNPAVYFFFVPGPGSTGVYVSYQWNGISSVMTSIGSTTLDASEYVLPHTKESLAIYRPVDPAARPELEGPPEEVVGGFTKWYFRLYGTGSAVNVKLYINADEEAPDTEATLVLGSLVVESGTPATTPTIGSNQINNITPDGGVALYSFQFNSTADGLADGQAYTLFLNII